MSVPLPWYEEHELHKLVAAHRHADAAQLALQLRKQHPRLAAYVAEQVELLQRAESKLPTWAEHQALLLRQAYEQASSEFVAALRLDGLSGALAVDLTAGLGVDAYTLAKSFTSVLAFEQQQELAAIAQRNFRRFGPAGLDYREGDGLAFLSAYDGPKIDLVFLDPDRRPGAGQRAVALHKLEPNVLELLPLLRLKARRVLVKLSPLFELAEAQRQLPNLARLMVLSLDGEVKEVVAELDFEHEGPAQLVARGSRKGAFFELSGLIDATAPEQHEYVPEHVQVIVEPDAAVYKAGLLPAFAKAHAQAGLRFDGPHAYGLTAELPHAGVPARVFRVLHAQVFKPKALKAYLKQQAIQEATCIQRQFGQKAQALQAQFRLKPSSTHYLVFTLVAGQRWVFYCKRVA